jgi:integrase
VRCHLRPRLRGVLLADLDVTRLQRLFAGTLEAGVTEATVRRVYCTLAVSAERRRPGAAHRRQSRPVPATACRPPSACGDLDPPPSPGMAAHWRPPVAVWTTAQTRQFLKSAVGHRLFAAYQLIALRGLRRGEACGLRWADLDLDAGLACITRQVQHVTGELAACPLKTPANRVVALDPATIALLRAHRSARQHDAQARGITLSGYVFSALGGAGRCVPSAGPGPSTRW